LNFSGSPANNKIRLPQAYISDNRSINCGKTRPTTHDAGVKFLTKLINQKQAPPLHSIIK